MDGRVACGGVHRGERAVVNARRHLLAVQDVEYVEDVSGAAYEAEHLGDVDGVARPRVHEQFAELRALEGVEAAGGAGVLLEDNRVPSDWIRATANPRIARIHWTRCRPVVKGSFAAPQTWSSGGMPVQRSSAGR